MAIVYSYPTVTPELQDLLVGTEMAVQGGEGTPRTKTFTIGSIVELVETVIQTIPTLQQVTTAGPDTTLDITANSFVKSGGNDDEILAADGSVITAGTNITILDGIISSSGGGGGATNLSTSQTASNFTINSSTGDDAIVPLGNGTLAGATLNDYTTAEKNKLAGINNADFVRNTDDIYTATPKITQIITLDAAQYAAATKVNSTLYIII